MAKGGNLTKLKSVLGKWKSIGKLLTRTPSSISATNSFDNDSSITSSVTSTSCQQPVFVGQSRRRYLISSDVVEHPLFQELVGKSKETEQMSVACEVVLFDHLLWMIENADSQPEPLDDLVQFYAV